MQVRALGPSQRPPPALRSTAASLCAEFLKHIYPKLDWVALRDAAVRARRPRAHRSAHVGTHERAGCRRCWAWRACRRRSRPRCSSPTRS